MASINQRSGQPVWSAGRSFVCSDPERQREVVGYVRDSIQVAPASRSGAERATRTTRLDWMRVQADRDATFEGSSSRRSR
jgi:hypothetical protein